MNEASDETLVARTCAGEISAYGELVSRYENTARAVAMKYVGNHHLAEDVAQSAFLRGYEKLQTLRDQSLFGSWLLRIVQREACNRVQRSNHATVQWTEIADSQCVSDPHDSNDNMKSAVRLLNLLPEHERVVVSLHYIDGRSVKEIAQMVGRPIGTITKQLSRAIKRIQRDERAQEYEHEH